MSDPQAAATSDPAVRDESPQGESTATLARRFRLRLAIVLALAAAVRLAHLAAVHDQPFVATLALDSAEYDRWARELAAGDWLGTEPFFQAPLYPYLLGALYAAVGRSLVAVYLVQIALGVAGLACVAFAARRALSERHALAAAALGALYLPLVFHEVLIAKEGPATALVGALLWALVAAREQARTERKSAGTARFALAGALLGLLALFRENALLLLPFLLPLAIVPVEPRATHRSLARAAALAVGLLLPLLPVALRNAAVGGGPLPTTFQGGPNVWIGNNPEADGTYRPLVPGKQIPAYERSEAKRLAEIAEGRALSAAQVSRHWLGRSLDWARAEPLAFARLQLRKLALYLAPYEWPDVVDFAWMRTLSPALRLPGVEWGTLLLLAAAGWGLAAGRRGALLPITLFEAGWLATTIAFFLFSRYRLPAVPGLFVLASIPLIEIADRFRAGDRRRALAGAAIVVAVALAVRLAAPPARTALVEFNLGRFAQEAGEPERAREHYLRALEAEPGNFSAEMNLGTLAARAGELDAALAHLERAVALEPSSDDAWANLGGVHLARGEYGHARRAFERALALNPQHPAATKNLELLASRERMR